MQDYEAVIFDMGGVLLNLAAMWQGTEWEMRNGVPSGSLMKVLLSDELHKRSKGLFLGEMSAEEFDRTVFKDIFEETISRKRSPDSVYSTWVPSQSNKIITYRDTMRAVASLKEKGYRTALLTNNFFIDAQRQRPTVHIDTANFDVVVESCRVGVWKPDEAIFKIALERLGTDANKCIFLDDSKKFCASAEKLGITSIHVNSQDTKAAVERLEEILQISLR